LARRDAEVPALVPVRMVADLSWPVARNMSTMPGLSSCIEIVLPGDRRVCVVGPVDREALRDVLAVLSSMSAAQPEAAAC